MNTKLIILSVSSFIILLICSSLLVITLSSSNITNHILPTESYLNSPQTLEGNTYRINASIIRQISSTDKGRLILVEDNESGLHVPLIVPQDNHNFHPQQRYIMEVRINNGILTLTQIQKL